MSYTLDTLKINAAFLKDLLSRERGNRSRALYYGWLGFKNLGDEALFHCISDIFKDTFAFYTSGDLERLFFKESALGLFDIHFVGGGTLVNRNDITIDTLMGFRRSVPTAVVFGTGVANEEFWAQFGSRRDRSEDWRDYLESCLFVGVRGPDSLRYMQGLGIRKAVVTGDPVLHLGRDVLLHKEQRKRIGLNFGTTGDVLWGRSDRKVEDTMAGLSRILLAHGWEISFFNVYAGDTAAFQAFVARYGLEGRIRFFDASNCSINSALAYFDGVDVFVGEKLHASVFAACTHTPFVMLEYRPKCLDFMRSIGQEQYNFRTDRLNAEELFSAVEELYRSSSQVQAHLYERVSSCKKSLSLAADGIARQLQTSAAGLDHSSAKSAP